MKRLLPLLVLLGACSEAVPEDTRTAIVLELGADAEALAAASTWWLVLDPSTPYVDRDGNVLGPGADAGFGN